MQPDARSTRPGDGREAGASDRGAGPARATTSPRIGVIVNEGKELGGSGLEALRHALADAGHPDPPWREVPKSKRAPEQVRRLVEDDGVDRLLVWGGDGTVRRCVHTILEAGYRDVALGVLPAGTSNLLAAELGIPEDLQGAVDIAVRGAPSPIDVGVVEASSSAEWLRLTAAVATRRVEHSPLATTTTAEHVVLELDRTVPWQVDGGDRERRYRFEVRCLPAAIAICRPPAPKLIP